MPRNGDRKLANLAVRRLVSDILDAPCCETDDYVQYLTQLSNSNSAPPNNGRKRKASIDPGAAQLRGVNCGSDTMDGLLHQVRRLKMTETEQATPILERNARGSATWSAPVSSLSPQEVPARPAAQGKISSPASRSPDLPAAGSSFPRANSLQSPLPGSQGSPSNVVGDTNLERTPSSYDASSLAPRGLPSASSGLRSSSASVRRSLGPALDMSRVSLNPNAAEFVPISSGPPVLADSQPSVPDTVGGRLVPERIIADQSEGGCQDLDRSQSHNSNASDDEYRSFWRDQLPDDIISFDESLKDALPSDLLYGSGGDMVSRHAASMPSLEGGSMVSPAAPDYDRPGSAFGFNSSLGPNGFEEARSESSMEHLGSGGPGMLPPGTPSRVSPLLGSGAVPHVLSARNPHLNVTGSPVWRPGPPGAGGLPVGSPGMGRGGMMGGPSPTVLGANGTPGRYPFSNGAQMSPQPSPSRGPLPPFVSPGHLSRFGNGPPSIHHAVSPPPAHPFPRAFHPEQRPGPPPPFELPPGPGGIRERAMSLPPLWGSGMDGFDMADGSGAVSDGIAGMLGPRMPVPRPFSDDGISGDDPVRILAAEFPMFSFHTLAEIFFSNGSDLGRTMEILTQLQLQDEMMHSPNHRRPPPPLMGPQPPPPLDSLDFPALPPMDMANGTAPHSSVPVDVHSPANLRRVAERGVGSPMLQGRPLGGPADIRPSPDFAGIVRKPLPASPGQGPWPGGPYDRNGSAELSGLGGPGRVRAMDGPAGGAASPGGGAFPGDPRGRMGGPSGQYDRTARGPPDIHRSPAAQPWLETGEAVANLYAEMREEARDHARVRNACFEQATQAYLAGNKALARELSAKGQWHNEQMKAAHAKAGESIFHARNAGTGYSGSNGDQARVLDLHGLHVGEALPMLKREIAAMRSAARNTRQRQQVFVCVGTGHHTKGRVPPRLPAAVERYLVEEEHLHFMETQPGMLRVFV